MNEQGRPLDRRAFLATAGLGTVATIGLSGPLEAAELSAGEKANLKVVNDMCAAWVAPVNFDKIAAFFADDCVYRASETSPPAKGREATFERLRSLSSAQKAQFQVVQTFAKGSIVVNERFDRFTMPQRSINWHGVGVFYLKDGKIAEWSDFTIRDQ